jgi:DNA polymerase-1
LREIFGDDAPPDAPVAEETELAFTIIDSKAALGALIEAARESGQLALVPFGSGADPMDASIVGIALSHRPGEAFYVPIGHMDLTTGQLGETDVVEGIRGAIEDPSLPKVLHDAKWVIRLFERRGVAIATIRTDTHLAAYLAEPNHRPFDTESLARTFLGRTPTSITDVLGAGRKARSFAEAGVEEVARYAAEQAEAVLHCEPELRRRLEGKSAAVLDEIELPLTRVLARMESCGIRVDKDRLATLSKEFARRTEELTARIHELAGHAFTVNSPQQLAVVLFDELELPVKKRGKSGPSTDASVLEELSELHPIADAVLEYREVTKLASTYVDALPSLVRDDTGRVHGRFNQTVAATGRLSSSDPNLQNIPVRSTDGRRIREAFVPEAGWRLIGADYSQIELRVLAHMSGDEVLVEAFRDGEDIHRRTAAEVLELSPDEVSSAQRAAAKAINFGLIYGMGVGRLSRETPLTREEAKEYIDRYFARIRGVQPFMDGLVEMARTKGYAETLFGRRRPVPELANGSSGRAYALGERLAKNTPIQGTAADIIKIAMNRVQSALDNSKLRARMLLTVHDELVFEAPSEEVDAAIALIREQMEGAVTLDVPLLVDVHTGETWAELK